MSEKTKKTLIIILFILVVLGLALLLYFLFFKPRPSEEGLPMEEAVGVVEKPRLPTATRDTWEKMDIEERITKGLPALEWPEQAGEQITEPVETFVPEIDEVADGGRTWVTPISEEPVKRATLAADGERSIYYEPTSGKFFSTDNFGNKELLTDQVFYDVQEINWAPTKDRAILEYPDGFKVMYDFNQKKQYTLPKNWQDFSWNSTGTQIAFKSLSKFSENNWLAIAQPDGSQSKPIEHLGDNADKVIVSWSPNQQVVAFSATGDPRGTWEQEILLIGQHQENFNSLIIEGRDFEPKWSPQGDKIVYSVYSAETHYQPRLYLVDAAADEIGRNKKDLRLATWAHKCAFDKSGQTLYCAVPKELPEGAGMVIELAEDIRDDFYKIDVETGSISFLAEDASGGYNVENIYVSDNEETLYFTDKNTGKLRYIRLK